MERSLDALLTDINNTIKTVSFGADITTFNLCYQQTKDEKTFPLLNKGGSPNAEGDIIHWDDRSPLRAYHRLIAPIEQETDPSRGLGKNPHRRRSYPMRAVFIGTRKFLTSAGYEDNENFARDISNVFPPVLSGNETIEIQNMEVDKNTVYEEEYEGVDLTKLSLDGIAFWIDYTIKGKICI